MMKNKVKLGEILLYSDKKQGAENEILIEKAW